jgi:peptidoglycan-associated lipoprotein
MRLKQLSVLLVAGVLALGVAGCKKKMDRVTPLPGYGQGGKIGDGSPSGNIPTGEKLPVGDGNANANPNPVPFDPKAPIPFTGNRSIEGRAQNREKFKDQIVYFEFDRSTVRAAEAAKVQEVANRFKNEDPNTDLLIEGHCDERGTEEYNRSLGERRALALRELLVAAGVPADRVHTLSFGKDKPAETGHNEAAWSKNRRGEFILVLPK